MLQPNFDVAKFIIGVSINGAKFTKQSVAKIFERKSRAKIYSTCKSLIGYITSLSSRNAVDSKKQSQFKIKTDTYLKTSDQQLKLASSSTKNFKAFS